jgi:hypothetical protein
VFIEGQTASVTASCGGMANPPPSGGREGTDETSATGVLPRSERQSHYLMLGHYPFLAGSVG